MSVLPAIYLLKSSLTSSEFVWEGDEEETTRWHRYLDEYEHATQGGDEASLGNAEDQRLAFSVSLLSDSTRHKPSLVTLHVQVPLKTAGLTKAVSLTITALTLSNTSTSSDGDTNHSSAKWIQQLKEQLDTKVASSPDSEAEEQDEDQIWLFDIYTQLSEWITANPLPSSELSEDYPDLSSGQDSAELVGESLTMVPMHRQIFYTHHLLSQVKQRQLSAWCTELDVWLLVKLGYPGFLLLEGPRNGFNALNVDDIASTNSGIGRGGVDELSRRIKSMQWAKLVAKTRVDWNYTPPASLSTGQIPKAALLACPLAFACLAEEGDGPTAAATATADPKQQAANKAWDAYVRREVTGVNRDKKLRTSIRKTETVKELVQLMRRAGIPEEELVDGLGLRVGKQ